MKKTERLDEAVAPDGTVLTLYRHDREYSIRVDGIELMSTRRHHSEEQLAELVCGPIRERQAAQVLIGGLGFGFTLKAALRALSADARVVVAEIVAEVIEWNRNPDYPLAGDALSDPRVEVIHDDVANVLAKGRRAFDAVMLDVDNGADALTTRGNAQLYGEAGIQTAVVALRPGGRLGYWSAQADPRFAESLRKTGLTVEAVKSRAHRTSGGYYTLLLASHDSPAQASFRPDDDDTASHRRRSGRHLH